MMKYGRHYFAFLIITFLFMNGCATKTPLIIATENGDSSAIQHLIKQGSNINEPDSKGYTPLMYAAWSGNAVTVNALLDQGANINAKDKDGYTPCYWALSYSYLDIAKILINRGADINAKDSYGNTLLHLSASNRQGEIVKYLLSKGADSTLKNNDGQTALGLAKSYDYMDIVKILNPSYGDSISIDIVTDSCIFRDTLSLDDSRAVKNNMEYATKTYLESKGYKNVSIQNIPSVCTYGNQSNEYKGDDTHHKAIQYLIKYIAGNVKPEQKNKETYESVIAEPYLLEQLQEIKEGNNSSHVLILLSNGKIVPLSTSIASGIATGLITTALTAGFFTYAQWPVSAMQTSVALIDIEKQKILWSYSDKIDGGGFTEAKYYLPGSWQSTFLDPVHTAIQ